MNAAKEIARNLIVLILAYGILFLLTLGTTALSGNWTARAVVTVVIEAAAVIVAIVVRARPAAYVIAVLGAFEISELATHSAYGIRAVQSRPVHLAVLLAAGLGVLVGALIATRSRAAMAPSNRYAEAGQ